MACKKIAYQRRLESQHKAAYHYSKRGYQIRQPSHPRQYVAVRMPGQSTWTCGVRIDNLDQRSYNIQVGSSIYRQTSKHIHAIAEPKSTKRVTFNVPDDQLTAEDYSEIKRDTVWLHAELISQLTAARISTTSSSITSNTGYKSQLSTAKCVLTMLSIPTEYIPLRKFERVSKQVKRYRCRD